LSTYSFSAEERYAVYTVHGERCYLCLVPIDLVSMEVDHVLPESLLGSKDLADILSQLARPSDFDINNFENWLPSCRKCNNEKSNIVFEPSLLIQARLQKLAAKKDEAIAASQEVVSDRKIANALNTLQRAGIDRLTPEQVSAVQPLVDFHFRNPHREDASAPVRLTPLYEAISDNGLIRTVRGPFGVGGGPSNLSPQVRCSGCGMAAFNGARCVICGMVDDD
jgi:hypothetical protein